MDGQRQRQISILHDARRTQVCTVYGIYSTQYSMCIQESLPSPLGFLTKNKKKFWQQSVTKYILGELHTLPQCLAFDLSVF